MLRQSAHRIIDGIDKNSFQNILEILILFMLGSHLSGLLSVVQGSSGQLRSRDKIYKYLAMWTYDSIFFIFCDNETGHNRLLTCGTVSST